MSEPHICPQCKGLKKVNDKPCEICAGTGLVWEPLEKNRKAGDSFTKEA